METTTISLALAASTAVAARALGPSSPTSAARVSGPRELLITTGYPDEIASLATWLPMCPAPMNPIVGFVIQRPSETRLMQYDLWFPVFLRRVSSSPVSLLNVKKIQYGRRSPWL